MPGGYKGNRGVAQNYLGILIEEGMTNSEIVDFLRLNDLGYRSQNMYQDINRTRLETMSEVQVKGLSVYDPVPDRLMREWRGDTEFKYRAVVKFDFTDAKSGERQEYGQTYYFDKAPSEADVIEAFAANADYIRAAYPNMQDISGATKVYYYRNT